MHLFSSLNHGDWIMARTTSLLSVSLVLVVCAAPCRGQLGEAIDIVPADSLGFLIVKDLRQFSDKIEQTAKKLGVGERVSFLELLAGQSGG